MEVRTFVAYIPLKFIHDFFAQMNFPMINLSLRITFNIAGVGSYTGLQPLVYAAFPRASERWAALLLLPR